MKKVIIACLISALAGFAVGYYTGGEYIRNIYLRLNRRMTDDEIRKYQELIYGKERHDRHGKSKNKSNLRGCTC